MSSDGWWRRELHRIRDEHRRGLADAAEVIRRARTPTAVRDHLDSDIAISPDHDIDPHRGSVLQPAHLDRREPSSHVETEPEQRPRSWLV
ncbi:hypothetical protein [Rhodococcus sp. MALMAid1271]|uniref:hypothetical protein n=1 Tax=Rhodococcus sp. MALMAid1271 TaxID=3411744 RepID=UPI003BA0AF4C